MVQNGMEGAELTATGKESAMASRLALHFALASGVVEAARHGRKLEGEEELLALVDGRRNCPWGGVEVEGRRESHC